MGKDKDFKLSKEEIDEWREEEEYRRTLFEERRRIKYSFPPDVLPLDKLRKAEEDGKTQRRVASKRMSLTEVNALIMAFRKGDKKAELALYLRYIKRIKVLMRKSPWYDEIKDPEFLAMEIWIGLAKWFRDNTIENGEGAVLRDRVRYMCRDQAVKDQREAPSGDASNPEEEEESKVKFANVANLYKLLVERDEFTADSPKKVDETYMNMRISFRKLIAKCVKGLKGRQREVLDQFFFQRLTLNEIGDGFGVTHASISMDKKGALNNLLDCFRSNGVPALDMIL